MFVRECDSSQRYKGLQTGPQGLMGAGGGRRHDGVPSDTVAVAVAVAAAGAAVAAAAAAAV